MINRRKFIVGSGSLLGLPLLESLGDIIENKKRLVFVFSPNGMNMNSWTPKDIGVLNELPPTLQPFNNYKDKILILSGLAQTKARANGDGGGDHARSMSTYLTGVQIKKTDGKNISGGISADQIAAKHYRSITRFGSLELGCESGKQSGNCDSGYSCAYSSTISWNSPTSPLPKDNNPRSIFERIYGGNTPQSKERILYKKSILDGVSREVDILNKDLSGSDKRKLEEYINSVRDIERRIEMEESKPKELSGQRELYSDIPEFFDDHCKILIDLIGLALLTDSTRVVSLVLSDEGSNRPYPKIEVKEGHHELSHHGNDIIKQESIAKINKHHSEQVAYLFDKLNSLKHNGSSILDDTIISYGCGIEDGNSHAHHNLPIMVGGGGLTGGKHILYPNETPLNNLWLSLLDSVNIKSDPFGDGSEKLSLV